jgi:dTDP-4-dehydrorhamnose reductase
MRILVLGASGMLGSTLVRWFSRNPTWKVFGSIRSDVHTGEFQNLTPKVKFILGVDISNLESIDKAFSAVKPEIVINCIGIIKQSPALENPSVAIQINSVFPHWLAEITKISNARLIHISTDCVFSGKVGNYSENDIPDAEDLYGRSKLLGEVKSPNSVTLRTSMIGHELGEGRSLINWFLAQDGCIKGYKKAIFSGFPTVELARVIEEFVINNSNLHGVYHVSADPISKYELLSLVAETYGKKNKIIPDENFVIDRSLNSSLFRSLTGFAPRSWANMVETMREFR